MVLEGTITYNITRLRGRVEEHKEDKWDVSQLMIGVKDNTIKKGNNISLRAKEHEGMESES